MAEVQDTGKIAVSADGTRLLLGVRCGSGGMERFGRDGSRLPVWLAEVQPCFGCRWFWLGFTSDARAVSLEVLASVAPVPPGSPESCRGCGHRRARPGSPAHRFPQWYHFNKKMLPGSRYERRVADGATECWLHGSRFDLATGRALSRPATRPVDVYPVRIDNDDVFVRLDAS